MQTGTIQILSLEIYILKLKYLQEYFRSKILNYIVHLIPFQSKPTSMLCHVICSTEILKLYKDNKILS